MGVKTGAGDISPLNALMAGMQTLSIQMSKLNCTVQKNSASGSQIQFIPNTVTGFFDKVTSSWVDGVAQPDIFEATTYPIVHRQFLTSQEITIATTNTSLTPPTGANLAEVYIKSGNLYWSLGATSIGGIKANSGTYIEFESLSEILQVKFSSLTTATIEVNFFNTTYNI